jgi:hypothetical protein
MRNSVVAFAALSLILAAGASAQVRGTGRLQGNVVDKSSGKPIAGAGVTISMAGSSTRPIVTKPTRAAIGPQSE